MIPIAFLQAWSVTAPWPDMRQVEQDLIISRALCDLFKAPALEGKPITRAIAEQRMLEKLTRSLTEKLVTSDLERVVGHEEVVHDGATMKRFFLGVLLCAMAYPGAILFMAREHWAVPISVVIAGSFTVAGSVLLALLILMVFRRRGWLRWWQLMMGGALIGGMLPFVSFQFSGSTVDLETADGIMFVLFTFVWFAGVGAIHALMLWAIAVRGNPWLVADPVKRPYDK